MWNKMAEYVNIMPDFPRKCAEAKGKLIFAPSP
jgi:hypothetical protein